MEVQQNITLCIQSFFYFYFSFRTQVMIGLFFFLFLKRASSRERKDITEKAKSRAIPTRNNIGNKEY